MEDDTTRPVDDQTDAPNGDVLEAVLAALEADDGTGAETLREALDLETAIHVDQITALSMEIESLRADVDELKATSEEIQAVIENDFERRFDMYTRRLQDIEGRLATINGEVNGLQSELHAVRDSEPEALWDRTDDRPDVDAIAADLEDLEGRVSTAFEAITSDFEGELERVHSTLRSDIETLDRRLLILEKAAGIDTTRDANSE